MVEKLHLDGLTESFVAVHPTLITAQAMALGQMFTMAEEIEEGPFGLREICIRLPAAHYAHIEIYPNPFEKGYISVRGVRDGVLYRLMSALMTNWHEYGEAMAWMHDFATVYYS